jgi:DNA polymerase III alpha subunit
MTRRVAKSSPSSPNRLAHRRRRRRACTASASAAPTGHADGDPTQDLRRPNGYALHPNGERHLRPLDTLRRVYPAVAQLRNLAIAERCRFSLDTLRYEYPEEIVPAGETTTSYLRRLTEEGFARRLAPESTPEDRRAKVRKLIEHELAIIAEARYEPFFLTVYDIVKFARSRAFSARAEAPPPIRWSAIASASPR